jgi:hypothetical protein
MAQKVTSKIGALLSPEEIQYMKKVVMEFLC